MAVTFVRKTNNVDLNDAAHINELQLVIEQIVAGIHPFAGPLTVQITTGQAFLVQKAGPGTKLFNVNSVAGQEAVQVLNGAGFVVYAGDYVTPKFTVTGTNGNVVAEGALTAKGDINLNNNALRIIGAGTQIGFFGVTPVTRRPANVNTTGATLVALETEVNELKQLLRDYGLLS
jgi:hypothetical protein